MLIAYAILTVLAFYIIIKVKLSHVSIIIMFAHMNFQNCDTCESHVDDDQSLYEIVMCVI